MKTIPNGGNVVKIFGPGGAELPPGPVKTFDMNTLHSNNPIEDAHAEAGHWLSLPTLDPDPAWSKIPSRLAAEKKRI